MVDFTDHKYVLGIVEEAQDSEKEQRQLVHEQKAFNLLKDGQWDAKTVKVLDGLQRYRGTFDQVSPVIDQISGEIISSDFAIKIDPSGGDATEPTAEIFAGIIRNVENLSNADQIYAAVAKSVVMAGLDGFEIVQEYKDGDTFDQDLLYKPVTDWYRSVWFDPNAARQDKLDAEWGIKLRTLTKEKYDEKFPDGSGMSVGDNLDTYGSHGQDETTYSAVVVAKFYYKKPFKLTLIKMNDGSVYTEEDYDKARESKEAQGIVEVDRRARESSRVYSRLMDGGKWLGKEEETVFDNIPMAPAYGNYEVFDKKDIYFGKTYRLMDPQRGLNFAMSAETEDVALSPPQFIMMTKKQGAGEDYTTMNIDRKAVRFFTADPEQPNGPMQMGGKMGSPGMQTTIANFQGLLQTTANMDDPSMGRNPGLQSGIAIDRLVSQSNNGNVNWFKSMEICLSAAANISLPAIPRVYSGTSMQKIIGEDGTIKNVKINEPVPDGNGGVTYINDLSQGNYSANVSMGEAFQNQQEAATRNMIELLAIDPEGVNKSRDILYKNQSWPGSDVLARRMRRMAIDNGDLAEEEYTEEDRQYIQRRQQEAEQQPPQEDPLMVAARAEELKGQAEMTNAQNKQAEIQGNQQIKVMELQLAGQKLELEKQQLELETQKFQIASQDKNNVDFAKIQQGQQQIDQGQQKIDLSAQDQGFQQDLSTKELGLKAQGQSHGQSIANQPTNNDEDS